LYVNGRLVVAGEATASDGELAMVNIGIYKDTINAYSIDDIVVSNYVETESATLEPQYEIAVGASRQLSLSFTPANASDRKATWTSSDPTVVEVDEWGVVTGLKAGTATITATPHAAGLPPVSTTVVVEHTIPTDIILAEDHVVMPAGSFRQVEATVEPPNASNQKLRYASSNEAVATVDNYGEVHAVAPGSAVIEVTSDDPLSTASATLTVQVTERNVMKHIYVSPDGDDSHDGSTRELAVRTLQRAQELVRASNGNMTGDIRVVLADGYYGLTETFVLDENDSGTNGYFVVYTHEGDGEAVIGSAQRFTG
jgi:uncharacterized protein YjdB